jgi:hypothetical protein
MPTCTATARGGWARRWRRRSGGGSAGCSPPCCASPPSRSAASPASPSGRRAPCGGGPVPVGSSSHHHRCSGVHSALCETSFRVSADILPSFSCVSEPISFLLLVALTSSHSLTAPGLQPLNLRCDLLFFQKVVSNATCTATTRTTRTSRRFPPPCAPPPPRRACTSPSRCRWVGCVQVCVVSLQYFSATS